MKKEGEWGVFAFLELRSTVFALFPSNVPERAVHKSRAARSLPSIFPANRSSETRRSRENFSRPIPSEGGRARVDGGAGEGTRGSIKATKSDTPVVAQTREERAKARLHLLLGPSCGVSPTLLYCTANRVMHPRDKAGRRIYGGISLVIERYAASPRYLFPPPSPVSLRRRRRSSCQSNWLRRATKILRCSSPLRGHLRAGDINQCRVFRVLSLSRFKAISPDTRGHFLLLPSSSKSKDRASPLTALAQNVFKTTVGAALTRFVQSRAR